MVFDIMLAAAFFAYVVYCLLEVAYKKGFRDGWQECLGYREPQDRNGDHK